MPAVHGHEGNPLNDALRIVADEPNAEFGNSSHHYEVIHDKGAQIPAPLGKIDFQEGPIKEHGVNGVTNEVLLAIVRNRLEGFQNSPFKCRENALAITKIEEAMHWLHHRTRERELRGVEGTNVV